MRKPRHRVRRTEPLPKMYALQYTPRQMQHRTAENARARSTSVNVPYACRQSGPEAGRKQVLRGYDGGLGRGILTGLCARWHTLVSPQVQRWPCRYSPSIQSRTPLDNVPYHCSFTQPNTCTCSTAASGHSLLFMRTSSWMACAHARSCQPAQLVRKVFHSIEDSMTVWLPRKSSDAWDRMRIICHIGQVQWRWLFSSSFFFGRWTTFLQTPSCLFKSAAGCIQECWHQRDASLQSSPRPFEFTA